MAEVQVRIEGALAESLARGRERYNARFAESRASNAPVDEGEFAVFLTDVVAPIAESVASVAPEKVDATVTALYDLSLELLSRELIGNDGPIDDVWRRLLPDIPVAVASAPRRVVGALSNAVHNLLHTPGARTDFWLDEMIGMGSLFRTADEVLSVGRVVAWRAGMAHLRRTALESVLALRPELGTGSLGVEVTADLSEVVEQLLRDPWADPASFASRTSKSDGPSIRMRVGAFRGFGGIFHTPPTVVLVDGLFLVGDDESTWVLSVDHFGATFTRAGACEASEEMDEPDPTLTLLKNGTVQSGGRSRRYDTLADASSWAFDGDTLVATVPFSHAVYVLSAR